MCTDQLISGHWFLRSKTHWQRQALYYQQSSCGFIFKGLPSVEAGWEFWSHLLGLKLTSPTSNQKRGPRLVSWRRQMLRCWNWHLAFPEIWVCHAWDRDEIFLDYFRGLPWKSWCHYCFLMQDLVKGQWGSAQPWVLLNPFVDEEWGQDLPYQLTSQALTLWVTLDN